jgi:molybdopterin-guanine dinucleotide biosynthesis protein A
MNPELPFLMDDPVWGDIGPMAGLLTAAKKFSGKNLLTIGCDYPFFNHAALELLATVCKPEKSAAFYNPATHFYEPLLAFYPAVVLQEMETLWGQQQFSLQQFLRAIPAIRCIPDDPKIIQSIDTPEAAMAVRKIFR